MRRVTEHDAFIGARIREARIAAGLSQQQLGGLLGVSYQQLQKYEKGVNRVTGARIAGLVTALRRPVTFFLPNLTDVRAAREPAIDAMLATRLGLEYVRRGARLKPAALAAVVQMIVQLTDGTP